VPSAAPWSGARVECRQAGSAVSAYKARAECLPPGGVLSAQGRARTGDGGGCLRKRSSGGVPTSAGGVPDRGRSARVPSAAPGVGRGWGAYKWGRGRSAYRAGGLPECPAPGVGCLKVGSAGRVPTGAGSERPAPHPNWREGGVRTSGVGGRSAYLRGRSACRRAECLSAQRRDWTGAKVEAVPTKWVGGRTATSAGGVPDRRRSAGCRAWTGAGAEYLLAGSVGGRAECLQSGRRAGDCLPDGRPGGAPPAGRCPAAPLARPSEVNPVEGSPLCSSSLSRFGCSHTLPLAAAVAWTTHNTPSHSPLGRPLAVTKAASIARGGVRWLAGWLSGWTWVDCACLYLWPYGRARRLQLPPTIPDLITGCPGTHRKERGQYG
jgi:hypothetical protein